MEALLNDDCGDDAPSAVAADPVVNPADYLANVDEEQALLAWSRSFGNVCGQEVDRPIGKDPAAEPAGDTAAV
ncbi:hypothetical protein ACFRSX_37745 [Streptomyces goshikiensis]|uniref:hypothetical protein n=1 Tax=Streptomyces TaxID=1883 RepID=UPI000A9C8C8B|nr:hypothetical protein [Streptomyces sp. CB02120-2]